jgi:hypothetical protein
MGLFYKPKTVKQVAEDFPSQYAFLKLFLFEHWTNASGLTMASDDMNEEQLELMTYIGQMLQYVFAEDPSDYGGASPEQIQRIKRIRKTMPEDSYEVMMQDSNKNMRKIVVYTLRMKTYLHTIIDGADWINTPAGKRTWNILQIYGGEFSEEVNDKAFNKLVNQVARIHAFNKATKST